MELKVNKLPKSAYEIEVTIPTDEVRNQYKAIIDLFRNEVLLPGFRRGSAPAVLVIEKVGQEKINQELLQRILSKYFPKIIIETGLSPITSPEIKIEKFDKETDLKLKMSFIVMPDVEIRDYQRIKVKKEPPKEIGRSEVEKILKDIHHKYLKSKDKNQEEKTNIIYTPQGEVSVETESKLSPDEAFAKELGFNNLTNLRERIIKDLEDQEKSRVEKEFEIKILNELYSRVETQIPDALIEDELNGMITRLNNQLTAAGTGFEDFLKSQGKSVGQLRDLWRSAAEKNVKIELALNKIAEEEKIQVSAQEIANHIPKDHPHHDHGPQEKEREEASLRHILRQTKTIEKLKELALK